MGVGIVEVLNNTSYTLHYHNTETGHKFDVERKTSQHENEGRIPSSNFQDDMLPWYSTGKSVAISLGSSSPAKISDDDWT